MVNMKKTAKLKVLLCKLPAPEFPYFKRWGNVPLAAGYLKAMAYRENLMRYVDIKILEYSKNDLCGDAKLIDTIILEKPDVLGFTLYERNSFRSLYIAKKIKRKLKRVKIIVGGPEVSREDSSYIMNCDAIDIGCIGAGEYTFIDIIKHCLAGKSDYNDIKGIFYRTDDGVRLTPEREPIARLDDIPSPHLLGIINPEDYTEAWIETTRGCFNKCTYCSQGSVPLTSFSSERIYKEIEYLMNKDITMLRILDNDFIITPNFKDTCGYLKKFNRNKNVIVRVWFQTDHINKKTMKSMKNTGIKSVEVGLQTINPATLARIQRKLDLSKFQRGIRLMKKANYRILEADVMAGLPGEKIEDVMKTIKFCDDNKLPIHAVFLLEVLPNTELRKFADEYGIKHRSRPPYTISSSRYLSRRDIRKIQELRHSFLWKKYPYLVGHIYPVPNLVSYSSPNIFNEAEATRCKDPVINNVYKKGDKLVNVVVLHMDHKFQAVDRLKRLGRMLRRDIGNPVTIWVKSKSLARDLGLIKALLQPITRLNPFVLWNIILETTNEFPTSVIDDIKKSLSCKEKIFDLYQNHEPINICIVIPWPGNRFSKEWLEDLCRHQRVIWSLDLSEKDKWRRIVKDIFKEERSKVFLLDFVRHSRVEFVIDVEKLLAKEYSKKEATERILIFRNLVLGLSYRRRIDPGDLTKIRNFVGSRLEFDKRLALSSILESSPQNVLDCIEWKRKIGRPV